MNTNISLIIDVLRQDLGVVEYAIKEKNFGMVSIIGNRIMSNLLFADVSKTKELMLIGWIVKEMGGELEVIKRFKDESKLANGTKIAEENVKKIVTMLSKKEYGNKEVWELYFDFEKKIQVHSLSTLEDKSYTRKPEFTNEITLFLVQHFLANRDLLLKQNTQLTKGILSDLTRTINERGATDGDYIFYIIFRAFDLYFDYVLYSETNDGKINEAGIRPKIDEHINTIEKIYHIYKDRNLEEIYSESIILVYDLSIEIRKYYLNYYIIHTQIVEKKFGLPEEAKQRIGETISKAFEEKLK